MLLADLIEKELDSILEDDWCDADASILLMLDERYPLLEDKITLEDITVGADYVNNAPVDLSANFTYYCELYYPELLV